MHGLRMGVGAGRNAVCCINDCSCSMFLAVAVVMVVAVVLVLPLLWPSGGMPPGSRPSCIRIQGTYSRTGVTWGAKLEQKCCIQYASTVRCDPA